MVNQITPADNRTLIIVVIISQLATIIVAVINRRSYRQTHAKLDDNTQKTSAVLHQVKNDHSTNLREDIDNFKTTVEESFEQLDAQLGYLGGITGNILGDIRKMKRTDLEAATAIEELQYAKRQYEERYENEHSKEHAQRQGE